MAIDQPASTVAGLYKQAQSKIPATISLPSHWLKSYEEFVTKNATSVGQIESTLRSLTYLIPGTVPHRNAHLNNDVLTFTRRPSSSPFTIPPSSVGTSPLPHLLRLKPAIQPSTPPAHVFTPPPP
ncbi:MAG: hypothetical protein Q9205_003225 [Flavoplaca limonia]